MKKDFTAWLNMPPLKSEIAINAQANNSEYIPIGIVQNKLDELFQGLWKTEKFTTQVYQNEIIGSIELHVFHPVAQCWIVRTGSASVMIQTAKGTTDKIKNTLVKDYPHLLSECLKSASKTLGASFGRNLNKAIVDQYQPQLSEENNNLVNDIEAKLEDFSTKEQVMELYNSLDPATNNLKQVKKLINLKISRINAK